MAQADALRAYVHERLIELLRTPPAPLPNPPWEERFPGAVMFVDVSGFTPLSEVLSQYGERGTERLTHILNRFYQWLVAGIEGAGAFVARFNGDAITAVMPGHDAESALHAALYCSLELLQNAYRHPPEVVDGLDYPLRIKIGVSAGRVYGAAVGAVQGELRYLAAGQTVAEASRASTFCGPMELLVPETLRPMLPEDVTSLDAPGGHLVIRPSVFKHSGGLLPVRRAPIRVEEDSPEFQRIGRFVPARIKARLDLAGTAMVAEHRAVTVLFARFEGIDLDDESCGPSLQHFVSQVFDIVSTFGGTVDKIEQADKGNLIMVLFGTPQALEHQEQAALDCALALREQFGGSTEEGRGARISRMGINAGLVYSGDLGAPWRHDYTVLGDAVNVASRLTAMAREGEILISDRVRERVNGYAFGPSRRAQLKGRNAAIDVRPLLGVVRTESDPDDEVIELPDRGDPLVGRGSELALIDEALDHLAGGGPTIIAIEGEQGVGKSALVRYIREKAFAFAKIVPHRVRDYPRIPFGAWRDALFDCLDWSPEHAQDRLEGLARTLGPSFVPWLSLLNPILGTASPSTPLVRQAPDQTREHILLDMLSTFFLRCAYQQPLVIVLEDFHQADAASRALLGRLVRRIEVTICPLAIVIASREETDLSSRAPQLHLQRILLGPLDRDGLDALLAAHSDKPIPPALSEAIHHRSQGNPLFAVELLHSLMPSGASLPSTANAPDRDPAPSPLPDSLRSLFQSRIDALPERARSVAKVASLLGPHFTIEELLAGLNDDLDRDAVLEALDHLQSARILIAHPEVRSPSYRFRHRLCREVLYGTMTKGQLSELHRRIGAYLEAKPGTVDALALARHFELGHHHAKAMAYYLEAGDQAAMVFANDEAIRSYNRALALLDEYGLSLPTGRTLAHVLETKGDLHFRLGAYREADDLYCHVRVMTPNWLDAVRCLRKQAEARTRLGRIAEATRSIEEALELLKAERGWSLTRVGVPIVGRLVRDLFLGPPRIRRPSLPPDDRAIFLEANQAYEVLAAIQYYDGSRTLAATIHRMADLALKLGEPSRVARAFATLSYAYAGLGAFKQALKSARRALEWMDIDPNETARVQLEASPAYALIGGTYRLAASWDRAEQVLKRFLTLSRSMGDVWLEGRGLLGLAQMWRVRGYLDRALETLAPLRASDAGDDRPQQVLEARLIEGICLAELGRFQEALACLDDVLARSGLNHFSKARALAYRGRLHALRGHLLSAIADLDHSVHIVRTHHLVGEHVGELALWRQEVRIAAALTRRDPLGFRWMVRGYARRQPLLQGQDAFVKGLRLLREGRTSKAGRLWAEAADLHLKADRGLEAARALYWQATIDADRGQALKEAADDLLAARGLNATLPGFPDRSPWLQKAE